jgi:hypothetical protein
MLRHVIRVIIHDAAKVSKHSDLLIEGTIVFLWFWSAYGRLRFTMKLVMWFPDFKCPLQLLVIQMFSEKG